MKKRIISLLAIVAILASLTVVPVYADKVHSENYDAFTESDDPTIVASWKAYSGTVSGASFEKDDFENGDLKIEKTASTNPIYDFCVTTNGKNMTLLFDMKQAIAGGIGGYFHAGGNKRFSTGRVVANPTANEWYSHMFRVRDDATLGTKVADVYIKGPFSNETEKNAASWSFRTTLTNPADSSVPAGIRFNMSADSYLGQTIWVDNFEIQQGLYMSELKFQTSYSNGGAPVETEVTTVDEIVAAATAPEVALETKLDFYDCDFAVGDTTNAFGPTLDVHPVLLALDENGMLLDCAVVSKSINPLGMNNEVTVGFSDIKSYVNQIDKVQLLIWDSIEGMQPIFDAIELN